MWRCCCCSVHCFHNSALPLPFLVASRGCSWNGRRQGDRAVLKFSRQYFMNIKNAELVNEIFCIFFKYTFLHIWITRKSRLTLYVDAVGTTKYNEEHPMRCSSKKVFIFKLYLATNFQKIQSSYKNLGKSIFNNCLFFFTNSVENFILFFLFYFIFIYSFHYILHICNTSFILTLQDIQIQDKTLTTQLL